MKDPKEVLVLRDVEFVPRKLEISAVEARSGDFGLVNIETEAYHVWLSAKDCRKAAKKLKQIAKWIETTGGR